MYDKETGVFSGRGGMLFGFLRGKRRSGANKDTHKLAHMYI